MGLKTAEVIRYRQEQAAAQKNGTLGPLYYPACYCSRDFDGFFPWLKRQPPQVWHIAVECGFNGSEDDLLWTVSQPNSDRATATGLFAESFRAFGGACYLEHVKQSING